VCRRIRHCRDFFPSLRCIFLLRKISEAIFDIEQASAVYNAVLNNSQPELKVRYPSYKTRNGRTISVIDVYNTIAKMPWQDQTSSYAILPASNQTDINRYINENLVQFITGQKPLNSGNWTTFIQGLDGLNVSDWENAANQTLKDKGLL
jgi:hypothetical protein